MIWLLACTVEQTVITPQADTVTVTETVVLEDTSVPCDLEGLLSVDTTAISWSWWQGEDPPVLTRDIEVLAEPCEGFVAYSSEAWLGASIEDDVLTLTADTLAIPSGRHSATVSLHDVDSAGVLGRIDVSLDTLRSPEDAGSRNVLLVAADGLDADALEAIDTPQLDRLAAWGALASASTQTADLTSCGPGWAAVLTGSEEHGVWTDGVPLDADPWADVGERVWTGAEWAGFSDLDTVHADEDVLAEALGALRSGLSHVHVVQLHGADDAGHEGGFSAGNAAYVGAVEELDDAVGQLVDQVLDRPEIAGEEWLFVLTSDHGGDDWGTHGTMSADYQAVPLLIASASFRAESLEGASHLDVAPTIRAFLGIDPGGYAGTDWWGFESACADELDDDGDGLVDCDDSDCADTLECNECPDESIEGIGSIALAEPWHDWVDASCGVGGEELLLSWTAPSEGEFTFVGDTVALLDGDCLASELACGNGTTSAVLAEAQELTLFVEGDRLEILGPPTCPVEDLGSGDVTASWEREANDEGMDGACGLLYGARTFSWVASADGYWVYTTYPSDGDTVLYVLDDCGGAVTSCSNDSWGDDAWGYEYLYEGDERTFVVGSADGSKGTIDLVIYLY